MDPQSDNLIEDVREVRADGIELVTEPESDTPERQHSVACTNAASADQPVTAAHGNNSVSSKVRLPCERDLRSNILVLREREIPISAVHVRVGCPRALGTKSEKNMLTTWSPAFSVETSATASTSPAASEMGTTRARRLATCPENGEIAEVASTRLHAN
jgi:hypothetical protein